MRALSRVVLSAWAGSLWTVCGLVVPLLFATLERRVAGDVATRLFYAETWLAAVLGALYLILQHRLGATRRFDLILTLAAFLAPLIFYFVLRPLMTALRASGDTARFASLHSVSSGLFLIACLATLALVWRSEAATRREE